MLVGGGGEDEAWREAREGGVPGGVLCEVRSAGLGLEDVGPGGGGGEGDFVGGDAHDGAVVAVQGGEVVGDAAAHEGEEVGEAGGGPEAGAGKVREGVEVEGVEGLEERVLWMGSALGTVLVLG